MVGLIVEALEDYCDGIAAVLAVKPCVRIHGMKAGRIVLIFETEDIHVIAHDTKEINDMEGVMGVYPVFTYDALPF